MDLLFDIKKVKNFKYDDGIMVILFKVAIFLYILKYSWI